jgi:PAS domain S-box-containing protein
MTAQCVSRSGGRTGFQGVNGGDTADTTATADLINLLDIVEVPIVVVRRDFTIAYFNRAAADVLGLSTSDLGRASRDTPALVGFPRLEQQCNQVIAGGVESRADVRNGDKRFVVRMSPYTQGDRQVTGTVLTFTNVTAFRASIDQAIYERECTKAILNTVADPLVVLSADQRIQSGNRAFYTMFGVSRDDTQGVPLYELGNGAFELAPLRKQLKEVLAGCHAFQPVEVDPVMTAKGQRALILDAHPLSFPGHSERRVLVTFQDITARKQAEAAKDLRSEEELRRSEAFLAEGQRLSLTGSFSWKVATDEITWSEQLYRIYEFEIGVPVTLELIRTRVHPEDVSLLERMKMVDQARGTGKDFEWQYRLLMPDRSIRYLHAVAHAIRDRDGQLEYIAVVQDVTARRMSEEALAKSRSELAKVTRVTSLGVLAASIAHEVNQPLQGIITNASTCRRMLDADPSNVDGARETARRTIRDAHRASDVITRLRALFVNQGATTESVDLNEATREVMALSSSELQRSHVTLQLELADSLPPVAGDRVQLQQVILNLLLNASDAMRSIDDRPRHVVMRTEVDGDDCVRLSVRDTGVGIDPQSLERIFDAFYTTKSGGMGIGLSVSRSIIESHHGRLWAAPNDDHGATFTFSVPQGPEGMTGARALGTVRTPAVTDGAHVVRHP